MMYYEFIELAGYEVSYEDYTQIIEPMYNATTLTKQEFIETLNKKRFALVPVSSIVKDMRKIAKQIKELCIHRCTYEEQEELDSKIKEYIDRKFKHMDTGYYIDYSLLQGCSYPTSVCIYSANYVTLDTISLT